MHEKTAKLQVVDNLAQVKRSDDDGGAAGDDNCLGTKEGSTEAPFVTDERKATGKHTDRRLQEYL